MSHYIDEDDLERSHELERRLERDEEREPTVYRVRRQRRRPRYFAGLMFHPVVAEQSATEGARRAA